jgi:pimeloyl-ACP methyl ester carboxylesterase
MTKPELGIVRSGAELVHAREARWVVSGDVSGPLVVFVHGFTAHGRYLSQLARYIGSQHYVAALFNYDSYLGIERAATDLEFLLEDLEDVLTRHGFVLVGHSMGGLVSRYFGEFSRSPCTSALRGIATLGTPHKGAMSRRLLHRMLDWADTVSAPNPFTRSVACIASRQLMDTTADGLIGQLNSRTSGRVPILSISGGLPFLELGWGDRGFVGVLRNKVLQRLIGEQPNDGLVAESSSDITRVAGVAAGSHRRSYPAYQTTNHTYLSQNQQIAQLLHTWLRGVLPVREPGQPAGTF